MKTILSIFIVAIIFALGPLFAMECHAQTTGVGSATLSDSVRKCEVTYAQFVAAIRKLRPRVVVSDSVWYSDGRKRKRVKR